MAPAVAAVAPLLIPFVAALWVVLGALVGATPFWPTPALNVAEAAAVRDHAEVVRLIRRGEDPNARFAVRAELIDGEGHQMTPLEAAVEIRRLELVKLLVRHGARVTPESRSLLSARAAALGAPDIVQYLEQSGL